MKLIWVMEISPSQRRNTVSARNVKSINELLYTLFFFSKFLKSRVHFTFAACLIPLLKLTGNPGPVLDF